MLCCKDLQSSIIIIYDVEIKSEWGTISISDTFDFWQRVYRSCGNETSWWVTYDKVGNSRLAKLAILGKNAVDFFCEK